MSDLGPLVPMAGLGGGVTRVTPGNKPCHVLAVQSGKMVHVYNVDNNTVDHTWYADTCSRLVSAVRGGQHGEAFILVNQRTVVKADLERNKIEDCVKIEFDADIIDIDIVEDIVWVLFKDGGCGQLEYYLTREDDTWETVPGVVDDEESILESKISSNTSGQLIVTHLVSANNDSELKLLSGRLVLDTSTNIYNVTNVVTRHVPLDRSNLVTWHLNTKSELLMVTKEDDVVIFSDSGLVEDIISLPRGSKHVSLTHVSDNQIAVMGTLSEGGYLQTVSLIYKCVVSKAVMKTTSHTGRGMFMIGNKLVICVSNRVLSARPSPGGLDSVLGRLAPPLTSSGPELTEEDVKMTDMPEDRILDCVIQLLDSDLSQEKQLEMLRILVSHDISNTIMSQHITDKFSLEQVIRLLNMLEELLSSDDCDLEVQILEWVNILVTSHYLQMVMSADPEMDLMRTRLQKTVSNIQEKLKIMTDCRITVNNLLQTKVPPMKISNQIYSIEIIQI